MAREPKSSDNIQVFRGSRPKLDVFSQSASSGCCGTRVDVNYDKLGERVRFDNGLSHMSPSGGVERYRFPYGSGIDNDRAAIINHINAVGVGAQISVIAIPTYAFLTGVGIHIESEETGLTFNLITRNGLGIPGVGDGEEGADTVIQVVTTQGSGDACDVTRTPSVGSFEGFGALADGVLFTDLFGRSGQGNFSLEADELILEVATMPTDPVVGLFDITVSASYDVIHRAER